MISKLNILEIGDVHLGHRRTSTWHIVNNLNKMLDDKGRMGETDLFIIAGDLFDRLLPLSSPEVSIIHRWIYKLLHTCHKHDITLRVLEGTPSHDNKQPSMIMDVYYSTGLSIDVKYIDTLSIEYIEKFDINVLYVPDEWHPDPKKVLYDVRKELRHVGIDKVDFAVMHGQFDCQLPNHLLNLIPNHDSKAYLEIVKYLIFIGHVHKASSHDRIIAAGSFDRLAHGEEESKGYVYTTVYQDGNYDYTFIENKEAKSYITIDCRNTSVEVTIEDIHRRMDTLRQDSYVRIKALKDDHISSGLYELSREYPFINFNIITEKAVEVDTKVHEITKPVFSSFRIDNLPEIMRDRLTAKYGEDTTNQVVDILVQLME